MAEHSNFRYLMSEEYRAELHTGAYLTPETHCPRCLAAGHPQEFGSPRGCAFAPAKRTGFTVRTPIYADGSVIVTFKFPTEPIKRTIHP